MNQTRSKKSSALLYFNSKSKKLYNDDEEITVGIQILSAVSVFACLKLGGTKTSVSKTKAGKVDLECRDPSWVTFA